MIGDQALQHFGKPFGWALAADALHADARAFAEEEDLVREELGFRELGGENGPMIWWKSDWLIVLRGRESRPHGEAASGS
jgi:hypothetical protein